MNCPHCGALLETHQPFCTNCGQTVAQSPVPAQTVPVQHTVQNPVPMHPIYPTLQVPEDHKPISPMGYLGYTLLYCIPIVGIICLLIFGFGGTKNINVRNYARSYGIIYLISAILSVVYIVMIVVFFGSLLAALGGAPQ